MADNGSKKYKKNVHNENSESECEEGDTDKHQKKNDPKQQKKAKHDESAEEEKELDIDQKTEPYKPGDDKEKRRSGKGVSRVSDKKATKLYNANKEEEKEEEDEGSHNKKKKANKKTEFIRGQ